MDDPEWLPDSEEYDCDEPTAKRRKASPKKSPAKANSGGDAGAKEEENTVHDISLVRPDEITGIANPPLKIASFNIQVFGERKMDNEKLVATLTKILQRYDLILILEIRDSSETALDELVQNCNKVSPENPFVSVVSARLGRTHSKEQYAFMYRVRKIQVKSTYQFDDGVDDGTDVFQREPFAVRFYSPSTELEDFAIIATHTDPDEADKEIAALHKVYFSAKRHWDLEDIMIAGDFNADEGYVSREDWEKIPLRQDKRFTWLIKDSTDTTTGHTDRAYDRFVVAGEKLTQSVVPEKTAVFKFDTVYGLDHDEARAVSDHYPIEMELCGKVNRDLQRQLSSSLSVTITQKTPIERENDIRKIYRAEVGPESAHFTSRVNYDDSRMVEVIATRKDVADVQLALKEFQTAFPNILQDGTIEMVLAYLVGESLLAPPGSEHPYIYGLAHNTDWDDSSDCANGSACKRGALDITITARLQEPLTCSVTVSLRMT